MFGELAVNLLLGFTLAAPVGPVNSEIMRRGLQGGFKPAFLFSLGACTADFVIMIMVFSGFKNFLSGGPVERVIYFAGVIFIIYLGAKSCITAFSIKSKKTAAIYGTNYLQGFLLTLLNPMTLIWWTGLSAIVLKNSAYFWLTGGTAVLAGVLLWTLFFSVLTAGGKKVLNEKVISVISLVSGAFLIILGLFFAVQGIKGVL
ncbi:MAG: LysE family transporter [Candidatus Goldbacteria bacterium]|nr:LysE family transporter [Candidatus Goldiibacteriota bacterium]